MAQRGELFSSRADTEKRTYFFNVKENRLGDMFLNIVESRKRDSAGADRDGFERHSLMVYEEELRAFVDALDEALSYATRHARRASDRGPAAAARESRAEPDSARPLRATHVERGPGIGHRPALSEKATPRTRVIVRRRTP